MMIDAASSLWLSLLDPAWLLVTDQDWSGLLYDDAGLSEVASSQLLMAVLLGAVVFALLGAALVVVVVNAQRRQRKIREEAFEMLRLREEKYRNLFENSLVGMLRYSLREGRIIEVNRALCNLCGATTMEESAELLALIDRAVPEGLVKSVQKNRNLHGIEIALSKGPDAPRWLSFSCTLSSSGDIVDGVFNDITQQKTASKLQRDLTDHIVSAQETERKRIAQDLHDSVIPNISAAIARIDSVQPDVTQEIACETQTLVEINTLLLRAIAEIRSILKNLRPSALDDFGLPTAVRMLCNDFQKRSNIRVYLDCSSLPYKLPSKLELTLYRALQEGLNNVQKHSRGTEVHIGIRKEGATIVSSLQDNGIGFDARTGVRKGMGIIGMQERVEALGGQMGITSEPSKGTEIVFKLPLNWQRKNDET